MSRATNIAAQLLLNVKFEQLHQIPGAFAYTHVKLEDGSTVKDAGIIASCPCGCGHVGGIPLKEIPGEKLEVWSNAGTREKPTLRPSVGIKPWNGEMDVEADGFHWHGWLTDGVWRSVYAN